MIPATLRTPSTWPCAATTAAGSASTAARSAMSTTWVVSRPLAPASAAVCVRPSALRSRAATRAPRSSRSRTTARPMPLPPPVTTNTLPAICMSPLLGVAARGRGGEPERAVRIPRSSPGGGPGRRADGPVAPTAELLRRDDPARGEVGTCARGPRDEPLQLGDVLRPELVDGAHLQQLHGAHDLVGEDRDRPVHAGPAPRHEAVEVGPPDEGEAGAQGQGGDDVGPVHDPGVQGDLGVVADLADHLGQEV